MAVADPFADTFASFVRTNTPSLLRTAYLITGSSSAAEELVQDTLVRLYPKWGRVEAAEQPLAYVRRCLVNGHLNQRRRGSASEIVLDVLPERSDSIDSMAVVGDRDQIWRLLATVPDRARTALVLRYFHDMTDAQIAELIGAREGTVRSLISRALAGLREQEGRSA